MRIRRGIVTHRVDQDYVTVFTSDDPADFHGILRSNEEADFIMDCLKEETDEDGILARMQEVYSGDAEAMRADIRMVLDNLRKAGALEE